MQENSVEQSGTRLEALGYKFSKLLLAQDIEMGVLPMLYAMIAEDAKGGVFYGPKTFQHARLSCGERGQQGSLRRRCP